MAALVCSANSALNKKKPKNVYLNSPGCLVVIKASPNSSTLPHYSCLLDLPALPLPHDGLNPACEKKIAESVLIPPHTKSLFAPLWNRIVQINV